MSAPCTSVEGEYLFSAAVHVVDEKRNRILCERAEMPLKSKSEVIQRELMTGPQTLIVGDGAVKEVKSFCSKENTKVLCFTNDMVSDISERTEHRC